MSQSTYSRWEASPGEIPVERMLDLQDALGVPRGSLVLSVTEMADCLDHQVDELSLEQVDYLIPKVRDLLDRCVERRQQLVSGGRYTGPERRSRDRRALS